MGSPSQKPRCLQPGGAAGGPPWPSVCLRCLLQVSRNPCTPAEGLWAAEQQALAPRRVLKGLHGL